MRRTFSRLLVSLSLIPFISACGGGGSSPPPPPPTFSVGGTVTGLVGTVVLQNNGGDDLPVTSDGAFSFATRLLNNAGYSIAVVTQPSGQVCTVNQGDGSVSGSNVTSVDVQCTPAPPALSVAGREVKTLRFTWGDVTGETEYRLLEERTAGEGFIFRNVLEANSEQAVIEIFVPDFVDARYVIQACFSGGCVDSNVVEARPALDGAIGYGKTPAPDANDGFSQQFSASGAIIGSLAVSADGNTIAVGVPGDDSAATGVDGDAADNSATDSGAVVIYARIAPTAWVTQAYIKSSNSELGDLFGSAVALSSDGNMLAVSAVGESSSAAGIGGDATDNSAPESGAVYLFSRDVNGAWTEDTYIKATNPDAGDRFGHAIALAGNKLSLLVGAPEEEGSATGVNGNPLDNSAASSGAAYLLTQDGTGAWSHQSYLKASNTESGDRFGFSVSIDASGNILAVGAKDEDGSSAGINGDASLNGVSGSGAVYIFEVDGTDNWSQVAYAKASNPDSVDIFGWAVALSDDGSTLAIGAPNEDSGSRGINGDQSDNSASFSGAVYILANNGGGNWSQQAYIKSSNSDPSDVFGVELDLGDNGSPLVVGAYFESSNATGVDGPQDNNQAFDSGAAYLFSRDTSGTWTQDHYLKAPNSEASDNFSTGLSISGDGKTLAIGSPGEDSATTSGGDRTDNSASDAGAVFIF